MFRNEKCVFTLAGQAQTLVDQITKETGKEIPVDNDLCELLSFAGTERKDNDWAIDLAMYKDILNEIDGAWRNLIYGVLGSKMGTLELEERDVQKLIAGVQESVEEISNLTVKVKVRVKFRSALPLKKQRSPRVE